MTVPSAGEPIGWPRFWYFYGAYVVFLVCAAALSEGWVQPDEHFRVLEPAHKIVYGFATLPWEFNSEFPLVSYLLGVLHAPILWATKNLALSGSAEAFALRAFSALFASTRVIAFYKLLPYFGLDPKRHKLYTLLFAFGPSVPLYAVRTSQENWATTALLWAALLFARLAAGASQGERQYECQGELHDVSPVNSWSALRERAGRIFKAAPGVVTPAKNQSQQHEQHQQYQQQQLPTWSVGTAVGLGVLIALIFSFRFQAGFSAAGLGLLCLIAFGARRTFPVLVGVGLGLVPLGLVDFLYTGTPFLPAWNYLSYALGGEEGGNVWGTDPWTFYVGNYFSNWYPPFSPLLLWPLALGCFYNPLLFAICIPFLGVHFLIGHKETRYLSPMLPFLYLASFVGFEKILQATKVTRLKTFFLSKKGVRLFKGSALIAAAISIGLVSFPMSTAPRLFSILDAMQNTQPFVRPFVYVADSRNNVSFFYYKHPYFEPEKIDQSAFLSAAFSRSFMPWSDVYALYRIDLAHFEKIESECHVAFTSVSPIGRKLFGLVRGVPRKKRLDAIVTCPRPLPLRL